jgi:hypothetical protein
MSRVTFSGQQKTIEWVLEWHQYHSGLQRPAKAAVLASIRTGSPPPDPVFNGLAADEVEDFFGELDRLTMLDLLSAAEAELRIDFLRRVYRKRKDPLSKRFRDLHADLKSEGKEERVRLKDHILAVWKEISDRDARQAIGEFGVALEVRHWLAHGRYWDGEFRYDTPESVFDICRALLDLTVRLKPVA